MHIARQCRDWKIDKCTVNGQYNGPVQWRIQGGGGSRGSGPPLLGHDVGFLTLGPKLDPLLDPPFFLVDLRWAPVADPGCVCVTGVITPPPLECGWRHRAMSKGGCLWMSKSGGVFKFSEGGWRHADNVQGGGGCLWKILYPRLDPPPFQKSWGALH